MSFAKITRSFAFVSVIATGYGCASEERDVQRKQTPSAVDQAPDLAPVGKGEDVMVDTVEVASDKETSILDQMSKSGEGQKFGWGGAWSVIRVVYWTNGCTQQNIQEVWRNNYGYGPDGARWAADQWRWHFLPHAQHLNNVGSNCPWPRNTYMQFIGTNNYHVGSPLCVFSRPINNLNAVIENSCY